MPDMSALDEILVEIAQTSLPSTRRHSSLDRPRKDKQQFNQSPVVTRTRPSLPNLSGLHSRRVVINQQDDLIPQKSAGFDTDGSLNSGHTSRNPYNHGGGPSSTTDAVRRNGSLLLCQQRSATGGNETTADSQWRVSSGSCTFPRRSARLSDGSSGQQDQINQVSFRHQNGDNLSSSDEDKKHSPDRQHLPCPFDTYLNLEFVNFCSNLASIQLPESVRQSFRRSATMRKRKWRKSMDQMLYTEVVLSGAQPPPTNGVVSENGFHSCDGAKDDTVTDGRSLSSVEEDSFELDEAVRTFEQTLQRHLSNTYKDAVGPLCVVQEDDEGLDLHGAPSESASSGKSPSLQLNNNSVQYFTTPPAADHDAPRESLFTVPPKRLPTSGSCQETLLNSSTNFSSSNSISTTSAPTITISTQLFESIRSKLAVSIEQMNVLQNRAQVIPHLEARILELEAELNAIGQRHEAPLADAGIMTSPDGMPSIALVTSATNTPSQEMKDSATCQSPMPSENGEIKFFDHNKGLKTRKSRNRIGPVRIPSAIPKVKRKQRRTVKKITSVSPPTEELNSDLEIPVLAEKTESPKEQSPVDYDRLPELQSNEERLETFCEFTPPTSGYSSSHQETDSVMVGSLLSPITEESIEECVREPASMEKVIVTVSTSGISEDSNASLSSSNSEELEMMASFATSESSDHDDGDEGSYDLLHGHLSDKCFEEVDNGTNGNEANREDYVCPQLISKELLAACKVLKDWLQRGREGQKNTSRIEASVRVIQHEWFGVAGSKTANAAVVNTYIDTFESLSKKLLSAVVNLLDNNGNTVLHYALSHNNFAVVSVILDSKVCNVDMVNQAGYTPVMLASLAPLKSETDRAIAVRLFGMGDINRKAQQHGQTALMLAVSHGRNDTVKLLLQVGADVNIQDNDGSTALMCASEHGHLDIVRMLLQHPDIDVELKDQDEMSALLVALAAQQKEAAALIYAKTALPTSTNQTDVDGPQKNTNREVQFVCEFQIQAEDQT